MRGPCGYPGGYGRKVVGQPRNVVYDLSVADGGAGLGRQHLPCPQRGCLHLEDPIDREVEGVRIDPVHPCA